MSWIRRDRVRPASTWPYTPDERDHVMPLEGAPQSDIGAPMPLVLASEHRLLLIYIVRETPADWNGTTVRIVDAQMEDLPIAVVEFKRVHAHIFGPPNDEAFEGHPLDSRGLGPYSASIVENSSWVRALERMNSVHEHHRPDQFWEKTHFIFAFHDSTFECVAKEFSVSLHRGSLRQVAASVISRLA